MLLGRHVVVRTGGAGGCVGLKSGGGLQGRIGTIDQLDTLDRLL